MASPSIADGGGAENRIGPLNQQHDDGHTGYFPSGNFNDVDGDDDGTISNLCPTNGRPRFMDDGEGHESYSAEGEIPDDIVSGHQGGEHQHLGDPQKDGLGDERGGVGGDEYNGDVEGSWSAMQTYNDGPLPMSEENQSGPAEGGAGAGGGGIKRPFPRPHSPHQDDNAHREPSGIGGATDEEAVVDGGGDGGDGEMQRRSSDQGTSFKQQQQRQRPGLLPGNRRPFRPGFREAHSEEGQEDVASSRGGGSGGREESAGFSPHFDPQGQQSRSGTSAFSGSDAGDASNDQHANPWNSKAGRENTQEDVEGSNDQSADTWNSKAGRGNSRQEEVVGEEEGDQEEEGGVEGQAQKRQRQQRRKHSELLVGNGFSAIARCYAAANCTIRRVEADQRNMLEAETEIREDLVAFGVRVKEATHLMQMQLNAAFTEDSLGASGS